MAEQNIRSLSLLRNAKVYTTKQLAMQGLKQTATNDGVAKLARYLDEENNIKTIVGFYANASEMDAGGGQSSYTILDIEGNAADIAELSSAVTSINETIGDGIPSKTLTEAINELNDALGTGFTENHTVADALEELSDALVEALTITLEEQSGGTEYSKIYTLKQGNAVVGTINIPKDIVIKEGKLVYGTWSGDTFVEDPQGEDIAIKLVLNNDDVIYINAKDLVDSYTAGNGITIDNDTISVKVAQESGAGITNPITVDEDGIKFATQLDCGFYD